MIESRKVFTESLIVAFHLTAIIFIVGTGFQWVKYPLNYLEILAVLTSFSCTYMCVKQSRWNYPMGIASTILLAIVFFQQNLLASAILNVYLIPTLIYGYFVWKPDAKPKPITNLELKTIPLYVIATAIVALGSVLINNLLGGSFIVLDTLILVGSVFAQFLLDRKKIETWFVWALVNVISIYVYFNAGLYMLSMQFAVFLGNTIYGYYTWNKVMKR